MASRQLGDPNFAQTVVLVIEHGPEGAMGLVLNRPVQQKLAALLPQLKSLRRSAETLFWGGPVARRQLLMLLSADQAFEETRPVVADLYLSGSRALLERILTRRSRASQVRVYTGYAGWGAGQLERELLQGDWIVAPYEGAAVFSPEPSSVWRKLVDQGALILAAAPAAEARGNRTHLPRLATSELRF